PPRAFGRCAVPALARPNPPEYALAMYGAMAAGGVVTGANPLLTAGELAGQGGGGGGSGLVTVPPFLAPGRGGGGLARGAARRPGGGPPPRRSWRRPGRRPKGPGSPRCSSSARPRARPR